MQIYANMAVNLNAYLRAAQEVRPLLWIDFIIHHFVWAHAQTNSDIRIQDRPLTEIVIPHEKRTNGSVTLIKRFAGIGGGKFIDRRCYVEEQAAIPIRIGDIVSNFQAELGTGILLSMIEAAKRISAPNEKFPLPWLNRDVGLRVTNERRCYQKHS
jgi:hypothetical protein